MGSARISRVEEEADASGTGRERVDWRRVKLTRRDRTMDEDENFIFVVCC
jgi:hypothetical protein